MTTVGHQGFRKWSHSMNPSYHVPHRTTIRNLIYRICNSLRDKLRLLVSPLKYLSITIDGWKSRSNISFLMMTGHWISPSWQPMSCILAVQPLSRRHTAEHLAEEVTMKYLVKIELITRCIFRRNEFWLTWDSLDSYCQRPTTTRPILSLLWTVFQEKLFGVTHIFSIWQYKTRSMKLYDSGYLWSSFGNVVVRSLSSSINRTSWMIWEGNVKSWDQQNSKDWRP